MITASCSSHPGGSSDGTCIQNSLVPSYDDCGICSGGESFEDIYVTTTSGDRLDNLAHQFYQDVDLWWIITTANPDVIRRDSFNLKPGIEIRIPQNIENILEDFEKINK